MPIYQKVFNASITDLSTAEVKNFQYNPEEWSDDRVVNYSSVIIPGISLPRYQFVSGGDTTVSFKLFLNALYKKYGGSGILEDFMWLRKRTYPKIGSNILQVAPPKILFIWPGMYSSRCVITSCNAEWKDFFADGKPKYGYINVELKKSLD